MNYNSLLAYVELYFDCPLMISMEEAETTMVNALPIHEDSRGLFLMGKLYKEKGNNDKAQSYLFKALTKELNSSPISVDVIPISLKI